MATCLWQWLRARRLALLICLLMAGMLGCSNPKDTALVVSYDLEDKPTVCWRIADTAVTRVHSHPTLWWEEADGVIHFVSGNARLIRVNGLLAESGAKALGVDLKTCKQVP